MKKYALILTIFCVLFSACNKNGKSVVRYLNFKPEVADKWLELSSIYEKETGNRVIVETAANSTYEMTLMMKMDSRQAPTIFQINGPKWYENWKDFCADVSGSEIYKHLLDKSLAIKSESGVFGIPYVIEGYGIIYNKKITDKYFSLPKASKNTSFSSMDEINNFEKLKLLVEDMQKNKKSLGIEGVFASTSLKTGEQWRWQTHLIGIPLYWEFKNNNIDLASEATKKISFQYEKNFKNIFDLYIENSTVNKKTLGTKTVVDSMAEFALEKCAMVQNGNWAWEQIANVSDNKVLSENIKFLPIYTGVEGEEKSGLCTGTENFLAINSSRPISEQKAALDFIYWCYSSKIGKTLITDEMGFITPFDTFGEDEKPTDPLAKEIIRWVEKDGIESVSWAFTVIPSERFKTNFGSSLLKYAQGTKVWDNVVSEFVLDWEKESGELSGGVK